MTIEHAIQDSSPSDAGWRFYVIHLVAPTLGAIALMVWLEVCSGNRWIADQIFAWEGHEWLLRQHEITGQWIHHGGRYLSLAAWLVALGLWLCSAWWPRLARWRHPLAYLVMATFLSTFLLALVKTVLPVDCPWDMTAYGGTRPYFGLFDSRPIGLASSHCFPAAHAGAGYAWVALYFFFKDIAPRWRALALLPGLGLGLLFGISQQLRGAHFASHDVVALLLCWLSALLLHRVMLSSAENSQS